MLDFEGASDRSIAIAPELEHIKYFAEKYRSEKEEGASARDVCFYNAGVAVSIESYKIEKMWKVLGSIAPSGAASLRTSGRLRGGGPKVRGGGPQGEASSSSAGPGPLPRQL